MPLWMIAAGGLFGIGLVVWLLHRGLRALGYARYLHAYYKVTGDREKTNLYLMKLKWSRLRKGTGRDDFWDNLASVVGASAQLLPKLALRFREVSAAISRLRTRRTILVAVVGEFNSGKSTFINTIIGQNLARTANEECTAIPMRIGFASEVKFFARLTSGELTEVSYEDFARYQIAAPPTVTDIRATGPYRALGQANVQLMDTPGASSKNPELEILTLKAVKAADVCLVLMDSSQPGSKSFLEFLAKIRATQPRIVLAFSRCDHRSADEIAEHRELTLPKLRKLADIAESDVFFMGKEPGPGYQTIEDCFRMLGERILGQSEEIIRDKLGLLRTELGGEIQKMVDEMRLEVAATGRKGRPAPESFKDLYSRWSATLAAVDWSTLLREFADATRSELRRVREPILKTLDTELRSAWLFPDYKKLQVILDDGQATLLRKGSDLAQDFFLVLRTRLIEISVEITDVLAEIGFPQMLGLGTSPLENQLREALVKHGPQDPRHIVLGVIVNIERQFFDVMSGKKKKMKWNNSEMNGAARVGVNLVAGGHPVIAVAAVFGAALFGREDANRKYIEQADAQLSEVDQRILMPVAEAFEGFQTTIERTLKLAERSLTAKHKELFMNHFDKVKFECDRIQMIMATLTELEALIGGADQVVVPDARDSAKSKAVS